MLSRNPHTRGFSLNTKFEIDLQITSFFWKDVYSQGNKNFICLSKRSESTPFTYDISRLLDQGKNFQIKEKDYKGASPVVFDLNSLND